jgi:hypothetical protein
LPPSELASFVFARSNQSKIRRANPGASFRTRAFLFHPCRTSAARHTAPHRALRSASTEQVSSAYSVLLTSSNTTAGKSFPVRVTIRKITICVCSLAARDGQAQSEELMSKSSSIRSLILSGLAAADVAERSDTSRAIAFVDPRTEVTTHADQ